MEEDDSKVLIPVYQDMNPYDFPRALSGFQMQDMGKVGAILDLVRGIKKILGTTKTEKKEQLLEELLNEKRQREEKGEKRKKTKKRIIFGLLLASLVILLILTAKIKGPELSQLYWTKRIENSVAYNSESIPDSNKYACWMMELNEENFERYFEVVLVNDGNNGSYSFLKSKVYNDGWVYLSASQNIYYSFKDEIYTVCLGENGTDWCLLPLVTMRKNIRVNFQAIQESDEPVYLQLVSKKAIKEYKIYKTANQTKSSKPFELKRKIELKSGSVKETSYPTGYEVEKLTTEEFYW